jgi:hypothetical protein
MKYYAISTTGNVADLEGGHKDLSEAWDHAECGPWEIAGVFTEDEVRAICDQLNVRFHGRPRPRDDGLDGNDDYDAIFDLFGRPE